VNTSDVVAVLEQENPDALLADGFEQALLGVARQACAPPLAVYDRARCIEILVERDGMDEEEAEEFFEFNVAGAYMGPGTPVFVELPCFE
jgi:hypothetical protein